MATTEEIRADLAEIVNEVAGIPVEDVQLDKSFVDDLDVDSLSMVEVVVAAEEKFGVSIPDDEVKNLKTVGDAVSFIALPFLIRASIVSGPVAIRSAGPLLSRCSSSAPVALSAVTL
jgi:acyl carrier protein